MDFILNIISQVEVAVKKYLPVYIDWLTEKLNVNSSFGTLTLVGFLSIFFLLIYVYVRSSRV